MVIVPDVLSVDLTNRLLAELNALPEEYWVVASRCPLDFRREGDMDVPSWLEVFHCVEYFSMFHQCLD